MSGCLMMFKSNLVFLPKILLGTLPPPKAEHFERKQLYFETELMKHHFICIKSQIMQIISVV